jgi:predicted dehydrogenase
MGEKMKRRTFLKSSVAAAGVVAGGEALGVPALGQVLGANDRIRVAAIGCGGQGNWDMTDFVRQPDVELVGLCDVFQGSIDKTLARKDLNLDAKKVKTYKDFRAVLDQKDIDAVIIATPDHWHALTTIHACQAGKDVYVEKPLSLTIEEGRRMVQAARKYNRVIQVGTQQRSAPHFARAAELVRTGRIGTVTRVHTWNVDNQTPEGIGNPPDSDPPPGLDWDLYLGPAPKVSFNKNRFLFEFRWFWDYSGGMMTDWGVHLMDIVHWAMDKDAPTAVSASGGKYFIKDNRETPDTMIALFEYPGFIVTYENRIVNGRPYNGHDYGIEFYGTDGTLFIDRSGFEIFPEEMSKGGMIQARITGAKSKRIRDDRSHFDHVRNFLDCTKSRQRTVSDVEIVHKSTTAPHLANIALRSGRKVKWDGAKEQIIGDPDASRMMSKIYREPWKLPTIS